MGMPETTVYEDDRIVARQNDVRFTRIAFITDSVAESGPVQCGAYQFFRRGVFRADIGHVFMALGRSQNIHESYCIINKKDV